jgi:ubiquitin carboxyl-terminal hydrolase 14
MPKVTVKWGREKFDVDANTAMEPLVLKSQLFGLTGVVPERQKVVIKGKTLPDDTWAGITLSDGATIMLMGSTGEVPTAPTNTADNAASNGAAKGEETIILPAGLKNLGNSCYMNATLQCFKAVPEINNALRNFSPTGAEAAAGSVQKQMVRQVKDLFTNLEQNKSSSSPEPVIPFVMFHVLHSAFPQFATRDERGTYQQQDANECYTELLRLITTEAPLSAVGPASSDGRLNLSKFFEGQFEVTLKNLEAEQEPLQTSKEKFTQLSCFLSQEVKYVQLGIRSKLTEEIEKNSESLGRNARYEKKSLIDRLPAYLSIQMVRFYYKEKEKINAKILKEVKFPISLDLYDMCTPSLQKKLQPARQAFEKYEERKLELLRESKLRDGKEEEKKEEVKYAPFSFDDDPGSNNSGFYELKGIITHKGRSSDSGHYVAWVQVKGDKWAMCDDDEVHPVSEEQVLKLAGGGDWHCAYVLLYGPRLLPLI